VWRWFSAIRAARRAPGGPAPGQLAADVAKFVKVIPKDYKRVLQSIERVTESGLSGEQPHGAFEENARDAARIGGADDGALWANYWLIEYLVSCRWTGRRSERIGD